MLVEKSDTGSPWITFKIRYRDGAQDFVKAHGLSWAPNRAEVRFLDHGGAHIDEILLQISEIASVIPLSRIVEGPLLDEIQERLIKLEARLSALEKSDVSG